MTTIGKVRHLRQNTTKQGHFCVLAIDHRDNLLQSLRRYASQPVTDADFVKFKQDVMHYLLPESTAVLTDPVYGIGEGIMSGVIGGDKGLLAPIEVTNYDIHPSQADVRFIPNWSVSKIKRIGGTGVKQLLYFHPQAENASEKIAQVTNVIQQCAESDIPYFLEPIAYSLDQKEKLSTDELRRVVVESARIFSELGVDILKLQFPVDAKQEPDTLIWRSACEEISEVSSVPWTLLSAGVDFETFARQAEVACQAGASGVIVGRAVWGEAVQLLSEARTEFLATTAVQRIRTLQEICTNDARDWRDKVTLPVPELTWYESY